MAGVRAFNMKKFIASLLTFFSLGAFAETGINTSAFKLKLSEDWKQEKSNSDQYSYYSQSKDIGITYSYTLTKAKPEDTERIAKKLMSFRLEAEEAASNKFNLKMTIAEPLLVPFSKGHQIAYFGHDNSNRQFRYLGLVSPSKTINIYAESKSRSQAELEREFNLLLKGLNID